MVYTIGTKLLFKRIIVVRAGKYNSQIIIK